MLCPWKARMFVFPRQTARARCAGALRSCRSQSRRAPRHRRAQAGAAREMAQDADDRESVCNLRVYPGEALPVPARAGGGAQEQSNLSSAREAHPSNFASSARPRAGIKDASLARSTATYSIPFAVCQRRHSCPICFLAVIARDAHARWRALKLHASRPLIAAWRALSGRTCAPPLLRARQGRAPFAL